MISASKSTLSLNNFKILRPKVTKHFTNLPKKFCEFRPRSIKCFDSSIEIMTKSLTNTFLPTCCYLLLFVIRFFNCICFYYLKIFKLNRKNRKMGKNKLVFIVIFIFMQRCWKTKICPKFQKSIFHS